jgi:hypothetical protein
VSFLLVNRPVSVFNGPANYSLQFEIKIAPSSDFPSRFQSYANDELQF